jgi:hypothetical protein
MAKAIGLENSNYSAFLSGKRGIGAESTCLLLKFIAMPKTEAIARFSSKPHPTAQILNLQERGQSKMRFDNDGWYPGTGGSGAGSDPNDTVGRSVDDTPDADTSMDVAATVATLRQVRSLHRKAIRAINQYIVQSKVSDGSQTPNTGQRFSARNVLKAVRFANNNDSVDTSDAVQKPIGYPWNTGWGNSNYRYFSHPQSISTRLKL